MNPPIAVQAALDDAAPGSLLALLPGLHAPIRGGENISPTEVEDLLYQHGSIAEAHVIGVPDDRYGEEVCAWIRLKPSLQMEEEEILEFCRGRIATYKVPRVIRFVDHFPTTASGKVQKFIIREMMRRRSTRQRPAETGGRTRRKQWVTSDG